MINTYPKTAAYKNVAFFYFVQFVLDRQMQEAHEYAKAKVRVSVL